MGGDGHKWNDLVRRDGIYYKKFTEVPFTGKTTGQLQVSFKNGKLHGPWIRYHDNGQLFRKWTYILRCSEIFALIPLTPKF